MLLGVINLWALMVRRTRGAARVVGLHMRAARIKLRRVALGDRVVGLFGLQGWDVAAIKFDGGYLIRGQLKCDGLGLLGSFRLHRALGSTVG